VRVTDDRELASLAGAPRPGALALLAAASAAVLAASLLAAFRLGFADDVPTALAVRGPRVLFAAAVGAALALSGSLRLAAGGARPLGELALLGLSTGAAAGGFALAAGRSGASGLAAFGLGAALGALLLAAAVRAIDRPRRSTNLAAAALLAAMIGLGAVVGSYARARRDTVAPAVAWLLGDLSGSSVWSALALLVVAVALALAASAALRVGVGPRTGAIAWLALGTGVGAAGPLAFVGTFAPRAVRWLAGGGSERARLPVAMAAGAATVAAIDAVPRLLVGGYDFPWNVPAAMVAIPVFLGWNRARLRRAAGPAGPAFELLELALIAALTLGAAWLAYTLHAVIRAAT
jgi:ABC-type Fe3+-siderophore transport system permease subunit